MSDEKLIRMVNQIAAFHATQPAGDGASVAAHLNDFWAPPMRADLVQISASAPDALHPLALDAVALLRLPETQPND